MAKQRTTIRNPEQPEEPRSYVRGPGRRKRTPGPNIPAYADGAIDRHCPTCGAQPLDFCHYPTGEERTIPCTQR